MLTRVVPLVALALAAATGCGADQRRVAPSPSPTPRAVVRVATPQPLPAFLRKVTLKHELCRRKRATTSRLAPVRGR